MRPFFCQVEAVETVIWLTEVAPKLGKEGREYLEHLADANSRATAEQAADLNRLALKLATGAGKEIGRHRNLDRLVGEGPELGPSPGGRSKAVLQGWPFSCRIPLLGGPHDLNRAGNRRPRASDL